MLRTDNMTALAVVGVSRAEAREFADKKRLPEPRVYLSTRDPLDGLVCAAVIYSPDSLRVASDEHMQAARRQVIKTLAPAFSLGTSNVGFAQGKAEGQEMTANQCHECGSELDKDTAMLDVDHTGKIVIVCLPCFWEES